jgi:hypothetical protein
LPPQVRTGGRRCYCRAHALVATPPLQSVHVESRVGSEVGRGLGGVTQAGGVAQPQAGGRLGWWAGVGGLLEGWCQRMKSAGGARAAAGTNSRGSAWTTEARSRASITLDQCSNWPVARSLRTVGTRAQLASARPSALDHLPLPGVVARHQGLLTIPTAARGA